MMIFLSVMLMNLFKWFEPAELLSCSVAFMRPICHPIESWHLHHDSDLQLQPSRV